MIQLSIYLYIYSHLFVYLFRHARIKAEALADLTEQKEAEKHKALAAQKAELIGLVEAANAERDEHLANYTKVCIYSY